LAEERCFSSSAFDIIWLLDENFCGTHNPLGLLDRWMDYVIIFSRLPISCFFQKEKKFIYFYCLHYLLHSFAAYLRKYPLYEKSFGAILTWNLLSC